MRFWTIAAVILWTECAWGLTIEKVLPYADVDRVRVKVVLSSAEKLDGVEISARIQPSAGHDGPIWGGMIGRVDVTPNAEVSVERSITKLRPELWSPATPRLYMVNVSASHRGKELAGATARFGFRSIEARGGQILLNGKPIFLRGLAINPPGRSIPKDVGESRQFAHDYVSYLRKQNLNIIRLNTDSQEWFDVCDELGMMIYQGVYGAAPTGLEKQRKERKEDEEVDPEKEEQKDQQGIERSKDAPPADFDKSMGAYKKIFEAYVRHPSIVIYVLTNEVPWEGARGEAWHEFLTKAYDHLSAWDHSRPYIANAGYGQGLEGDINDVHRYWGWYYNSYLTYFNLRDPRLFGDYEKNQPFTFSECVGNFTGPTGAYNLTYKKQLGAQLGWSGHAADQESEAQKYQAFMNKQAIESFRRMRAINPRISGLMPFTIAFRNWRGVESFDQMKPTAAAEQMGVSYQPLLLSWEMWTPQVYAGTRVKAIAHVVNDSEDASDLVGATLTYEIKGVARGEVKLPKVAYYATWRGPITIELPAAMKTGDYKIEGRVMKGAREVSRNEIELFVAGPEWKQDSPKARVQVYDPSAKTRAAFMKLGIAASAVSSLNRLDASLPLVIGEDAWDQPVGAAEESLRKFIDAGGHVLCLGQDPKTFDTTWLPARVQLLATSANDPAYLERKRPTRDQMNINPERPWHPALAGLPRERLAHWSDYTQWDQSKSGFPRVYPVTHGFKLRDADDLSKVAILANYDRGLEGIALCEMFEGKGSVVMCAFDLTPRIGLDPAADRLLQNLIAYVSSATKREVHPLIEKPIVWGQYETERGVISGHLSGLIYNCRWLPPPTDPNAKPLKDNEGSWNMMPGDQFVAEGVRAIGPFEYSNGTAVRELEKQAKTGTGNFFCFVGKTRRFFLTKLQNPANHDLEMVVEINGGVSKQAASVSAGQTIDVRVSLPEVSEKEASKEASGTRAIQVRYTGAKELVILESAFE